MWRGLSIIQTDLPLGVIIPNWNLDFVDFSINPKSNLRYSFIEDKMAVKLEPTRIKESVYLLIPKSIAELVDITSNTQLILKVSKTKDSSVLEYHLADASKN